MPNRYSVVPPGGESWEQMEKRAVAAINEILAMPHKSVAVVTHWGVIRALLPVLQEEPRESTLQLQVDYCQSFVLELDAAQ